jgi:hypothetical protein
MIINGIDTINIMHGVNGDEAVYMRRDSAKDMIVVPSLTGLSEWIMILENVEQDPVLQDMLERVIVYHRLKRNNDGKSS